MPMSMDRHTDEKPAGIITNLLQFSQNVKKFAGSRDIIHGTVIGTLESSSQNCCQ